MMGCSSELLRHPLIIALVQLGSAILVGWFLTERWQRWRQQREFQHRTLGKFSELSYDLMNRLSELLVGRGRIEYREKHREQVARWILFISMRPEVIAAYGRQFVLGKDYQGLRAMGLLSKKDWDAEITQWERRLAEAKAKQEANPQSGLGTTETNRQ